MDLNRQGPSRRHISSSSHNQPSGLGFSESYFTVDSDDFGGQQPEEQKYHSSPPPPPQRPSSTFSSNSNTFSGQFSSPPPPTSSSSSFFNPQQQVPQTNNQSFGGGNQQWQTPIFPQSPPFGAGIPPGQSSPFMNQQLLMAAGQQLLSNPMTAAAIDAYSQSLMDKSKGWLGNLKQYFAVDTNYAVKKLLLLFLPFLHKDWSIRYSSETVAPRDEPNLPDLYIPSMAFITYILVSGYILGLRNQFQPEQLGIYASSALAWLLLEVILIMIAKYLLNLSSSLGFFHMIAFGGYKFVCIDLILLISVIFGHNAYLFLFIYTSISLGYFLLRALSTNLQQGQQSNYQHNVVGHDPYSSQHHQSYSQSNPRTAYYLVIFIALLQPVVMYFLTNSLTNFNKIAHGISSTNPGAIEN